MIDRNYYEMLGVDESSSFEEIQEARSRLIKELGNDHKQVEVVETAYDAILMERLRLRQEGKIKVPDRIRFPERQAPAPASEAKPAETNRLPGWIENLLDTPSRGDVLWPAAVMGGASLLVISMSATEGVSVAIALGVGASIYFLNRKARKLGRSVLLTLAGLIVGILAGLQLATVMAGTLANINLAPEAFAALFTFVVLWLVSSFLR